MIIFAMRRVISGIFSWAGCSLPGAASSLSMQHDGSAGRLAEIPMRFKGWYHFNETSLLIPYLQNLLTPLLSQFPLSHQEEGTKG
jgi:hypothetical protein